MTASRLDACLTALVAACGSDATLSGLSVTVSDGLPISADYTTALLVLGGNPDEGAGEVATLTQEWHDSGAGSSPARMEYVRIRCYVAASTGDVDLATTRASAFEILAAVEALLRADRALGVAGVISSSLTDVTYSPSQYGDGTVVFLPFVVEFRSLI